MAKNTSNLLSSGHVLRIKTPIGIAYAICTHRDAICGHLIRVMGDLHNNEISHLDKLFGKEEAFSIFFLWGSNVDKSLVDIAGRIAIPEHMANFPLFKAGIVNQRTGKVDHWWLWDGNKEWPVGKLTVDQRLLPLREIWNEVLLVERIAAGWRASDVH